MREHRAQSPLSEFISFSALVKLIIVLVLVVLGSRYLSAQFQDPYFGVDDANIFFVYARHISGGHGAVYNIGGEHVEGFTSLLYVLILSLLYLIKSAPEKMIFYMEIAIVSLALTGFVIAYDRIQNNLSSSKRNIIGINFRTGLLIAWIFSSPAYLTWTVLTLMDTGLWSGLVLTGVSMIGLVLLYPNSKLVQGLFVLLLGLMVIARPEGAFFLTLVVGLVFYLLWCQGFSTKSAIRYVLPLVLFPWVVFLALTGFRLSYFGYPFPNTFYAKVSPNWTYNLITGFEYFEEFISSNIFITLGITAALVWLMIGAVRLRNRERWADPGEAFNLAVSILLLGGVTLPIILGGDHFKWFRFFQPIWPLVIIPLIHIISKMTNTLFDGTALQAWFPRSSLMMIPAFLLFIFASSPSWLNPESTNLQHEFNIAVNGRTAGTVFKDLFSGTDYPTLGEVRAGGIKVTYPGDVIDLLGLNNLRMGHESGDRYGFKNHAAFSKKVFYEQQPQILLPLYTPELPEDHPYQTEWFNTTLQNLFTDEKFLSTYTVSAMEFQGIERSQYLTLIVRNDYLPELIAASSEKDIQVYIYKKMDDKIPSSWQPAE